MDQDPNSSNAKIWAERLLRGVNAGVRALGDFLLLAWSVARGPLIVALNILAALIIIFEEWGWRPLHDAAARLARFVPIAITERWIASLPPYGALLAFGLPVAVLLPFKLLALYLLAGGHYLSATFVFVTAKLIGTACLARIFMLTKPALMQISWFAAAYEKFAPWKDALFETIRKSRVWRYGRMLKTRMRLGTSRVVARTGPKLMEWSKISPTLAHMISMLPEKGRAALERMSKSS